MARESEQNRRRSGERKASKDTVMQLLCWHLAVGERPDGPVLGARPGRGALQQNGWPRRSKLSRFGRPERWKIDLDVGLPARARPPVARQRPRGLAKGLVGSGECQGRPACKMGAQGGVGGRYQALKALCRSPSQMSEGCKPHHAREGAKRNPPWRLFPGLSYG